MKTLRHLVVLCVLIASVFTVAAAEKAVEQAQIAREIASSGDFATKLIRPAAFINKAPALPIESALKIAQGYLQRNDPKGVIVGLTLEKGALLGGTQRWYAKWSAPIRRDGKTEVGLEIGMDGSLTRVVGRGALVAP